MVTPPQLGNQLHLCEYLNLRIGDYCSQKKSKNGKSPDAIGVKLAIETALGHKAIRNGLVYGARIRAPHALVMTFLFGKGTLQQKLANILKLTRTHAVNLALFVGLYKLGTGVLASLFDAKHEWHSAFVAAVFAYHVFGEYNSVNMQIILYSLSRIIAGGAKLLVNKDIISEPKIPVFPWFAALVVGVLLWMFEYHQPVLQNSLQSSMTYLYHDSDHWTGIKDLLLVNKLEQTKQI